MAIDLSIPGWYIVPLSLEPLDSLPGVRSHEVHGLLEGVSLLFHHGDHVVSVALALLLVIREQILHRPENKHTEKDVRDGMGK